MDEQLGLINKALKIIKDEQWIRTCASYGLVDDRRIGYKCEAKGFLRWEGCVREMRRRRRGDKGGMCEGDEEEEGRYSGRCTVMEHDSCQVEIIRIKPTHSRQKIDTFLLTTRETEGGAGRDREAKRAAAYELLRRRREEQGEMI